jgi:hypothetical protein
MFYEVKSNVLASNLYFVPWKIKIIIIKNHQLFQIRSSKSWPDPNQ